jgi:hypothetical protein
MTVTFSPTRVPERVVHDGPGGHAHVVEAAVGLVGKGEVLGRDGEGLLQGQRWPGDEQPDLVEPDPE